MNRLYGKRYPLDMKIIEGTQKFRDEACRAGSQRDWGVDPSPHLLHAVRRWGTNCRGGRLLGKSA
jgi:hypothetical protein